MNYPGYAMTSGEGASQEKVSKRYKELTDVMHGVEVKKFPAYGHVKFEAKIVNDVAKDLSEWDVLIIADRGNLCFGGSCTKQHDGSFKGSYYTD